LVPQKMKWKNSKIDECALDARRTESGEANLLVNGFE
jgi:hypothetical protein